MVVDLDVIRKRLGVIVLLVQHDDGAIVMQEDIEEFFKLYRFFALEQQPRCLDTVGDVSSAELPGQLVLVEIHSLQQVKSFSCNANNSPAVILDTHYGGLYRGKAATVKVPWASALGVEQCDVHPIQCLSQRRISYQPHVAAQRNIENIFISQQCCLYQQALSSITNSSLFSLP